MMIWAQTVSSEQKDSDLELELEPSLEYAGKPQQELDQTEDARLQLREMDQETGVLRL